MSNIRVRLQFDDDEKYWLFIDLKKTKTIQDVIDDINYKYDIDCDKLLLDDAQLYCKETVNILQDKDLIRVCFKKKKTKRAQLSEASVEEPPPQPKKKKKHKETSKDTEWEDVTSHEIEIVAEIPKVPLPEKRKKEKKKEVSPECEEQPQVNISEIDTSNIEPTAEDDGAKRKRRRRRRKSHHKTSPTIVMDTNAHDVFPSTHVPDEPKERLHVRFDDTSAIETEPESTQQDEPVNGIQKTSNGFEKANPLYLGEVKVKGYKTLAKPEVFKSPSAASSPVIPQLGALLSLRSAVFSRNSNEKAASYNSVPPPPPPVSSKVVPVSKEPVKLDPLAFPIINGPPRINDVIAFKVLELSENYNPEISDYMQGRVSYIHPSGDVTVDLLDPRVKRHARGKFEILETEEDEEEEANEMEEEYESTVTYSWNQMIEPRLIFP